jgi:hypothetical protein
MGRLFRLLSQVLGRLVLRGELALESLHVTDESGVV